MTDLKHYVYTKGTDAAMDAEYENTKAYSKVRPGQRNLFWRNGLRRYAMPLNNVRRIYRRVEPVYGRLCCGGRNFIIEWLVLVLHDGSEMVIHIGDDVKQQAEELLLALQDMHPQLRYGKVYD